jgi:hypothetical protein
LYIVSTYKKVYVAPWTADLFEGKKSPVAVLDQSLHQIWFGDSNNTVLLACKFPSSEINIKIYLESVKGVAEETNQ